MKTIANLSAAAIMALVGSAVGSVVSSTALAAETDQKSVEIYEHVAATKLVQPKYPDSALRKQVNGYVVLEYSIDSKGKVADVDVVESSPKGVFDRAAIRALKRSRFEVTTIDGNKVEVAGQSKRYTFGIDQRSRAALAKLR